MKLRNVLGMFLSLGALAIAGCGGGDGAGGTAVSGTAAAGLVSGGSVQVFQIFSTHNPAKARISATPLAGATATTTANGSFAIALPATVKNGGLLLKLTGGTYKDEATGTAGVTVDSQAANGLRAVFSNISGAVKRGSVTMNITPFTEMAVQSLLGLQTPTDANIATANANVAAAFAAYLDGADILTTKPYDVTVAPPAGATAAQTAYTLALATLSQAQLDNAPLTLDQIFADLLAEVNAGALSTNSDGVKVANLNFFNNANNKTGTTAPGVTVTVTPATATTAAVTTNVAIAATVQQNSVNVPDGTQVKFAIKSGTNGTLSAATATTVGGVATVNLTSATDTAAFVITATAGGVLADTATITFADPNKPGAITLAANPTTGVINGLGPVTLTATVTPAGAAGAITNETVTFTIVSGTGTLSSATATTTPGTVAGTGVASVTLNSTAAGTVVVNARAGSAPVVISSPNTSVPFIAAPTLVVVKLATSGTLPAGGTIDGLQFVLNYATNKGLSIVDAGIVASGVATANLIVPNTTVNGVVNAAFANANASPIATQTGEFGTLTFSIAPNNPPFFPVAGDFTIASSTVSTTPAANPALTVTILSVTPQ